MNRFIGEDFIENLIKEYNEDNKYSTSVTIENRIGMEFIKKIHNNSFHNYGEVLSTTLTEDDEDIDFVDVRRDILKSLIVIKLSDKILISEAMEVGSFGGFFKVQAPLCYISNDKIWFKTYYPDKNLDNDIANLGLICLNAIDDLIYDYTTTKVKESIPEYRKSDNYSNLLSKEIENWGNFSERKINDFLVNLLKSLSYNSSYLKKLEDDAFDESIESIRKSIYDELRKKDIDINELYLDNKDEFENLVEDALQKHIFYSVYKYRKYEEYLKAMDEHEDFFKYAEEISIYNDKIEGIYKSLNSSISNYKSVVLDGAKANTSNIKLCYRYATKNGYNIPLKYVDLDFNYYCNVKLSPFKASYRGKTIFELTQEEVDATLLSLEELKTKGFSIPDNF